MKKAVKKISSRKIITISAILVSVYLAMLIVVTSLQNKLKESQHIPNQLEDAGLST